MKNMAIQRMATASVDDMRLAYGEIRGLERALKMVEGENNGKRNAR